jgi:hypothetical protein
LGIEAELEVLIRAVVVAAVRVELVIMRAVPLVAPEVQVFWLGWTVVARSSPIAVALMSALAGAVALVALALLGTPAVPVALEAEDLEAVVEEQPMEVMAPELVLEAAAPDKAAPHKAAQVLRGLYGSPLKCQSQFLQ